MKNKNLRIVYTVAGALSLILFVAGFVTGYYLQRITFSLVENDISSVRSDLEKIQDEYVLFSLGGNESCKLLPALSSDIATRLRTVVDELNRLENSGQTGKTFLDLKKDYASLSVRAWILKSNIKDNCQEDIVPILYYYSIPCSDCIEQGKILDNLTTTYNNKIIVFTLDSGLDMPLVKTLVKSHNITQTPALIIGPDIYQGLIQKEELNKIICQNLKEGCTSLQ